MKVNKRAVVLFMLVSLMSLCIFSGLTSCGGDARPNGKYYLRGNIYYEFGSNGNAKLVTFAGTAKYTYVVNDDYEESVDSNGNIHKTYVVTISDTNSMSVNKLIYDAYLDTIWDPELGTFRK